MAKVTMSIYISKDRLGCSFKDTVFVFGGFEGSQTHRRSYSITDTFETVNHMHNNGPKNCSYRKTPIKQQEGIKRDLNLRSSK